MIKHMKMSKKNMKNEQKYKQHKQKCKQMDKNRNKISKKCYKNAKATIIGQDSQYGINELLLCQL